MTFFSGGYIGVDVFFVISGYLITGLLIRDLESENRLRLVLFYARRIQRLLPAFLAVALACLASAYVLYSPLEQIQFTKTSLAAFLYLGNILFARRATDYFEPNADLNPLLHTWSLAVEEQFYLVWPALITLGVLGATVNFRRRVILTLTGTIFISLTLCVYLTIFKPSWAFFLMPARAWEFALGGLIFALPLRESSGIFWGRLRAWLGFIGISGICLASVGFNETTHFPGVAALLPALSTAAVLYSGGSRERQKGLTFRFLDIAPLQRIGDWSYSWYLWHWPILIFGTMIFPKSDIYTNLFLLGISLLLAALTFRYLENPARHLRKFHKKPLHILLLGTLLTVLGVAATFGLYQGALRAAHTDQNSQFTEAALNYPELYKHNCNANFNDENLNECIFGDSQAKPVAILFGDSHAAQWFPSINILAEKNGWRLIPFTKAACPAADISYSHPRLGRVYRECSNWHEKVFNRVRELNPDFIFVTNSHYYVHDNDYSISLDEWREGWRRTFNALVDAGTIIIHLRDTPRPGFHVPQCLQRNAWWPGFLPKRDCSFEVEGALGESVYAEERSIVELYKNVISIDLTSHFCESTSCPSQIDGQVVYRDSNHITANFAQRLAPLIYEMIAGAIEAP